MPSEKTLQIGLIGAGRIGQLHAQNLAHWVPGARLAAVADVQLPAAQACAARHGVKRVHADPQPLFDDPDLDAVLICSSTDTHAGFIERAAAAGKHVFCEKPIDFDLTNIDRALAAIERAGVILQIGFNRRFDPHFARVRQAVADGEVGTPQLLRITSRDPAPPPLGYIKVSGGMFLDMTIHDFDMARFLMGREIVEVFAAGAVLVDPAIGQAGDIDTATVTLRFEGGALGTIDNSRQARYGYDQRVEVFGSKGMAAADNPLPHLVRLGTQGGFAQPPLLDFFLERYTESYVAELSAFVTSVRENAPPPVGGLDGRIPVVIGLAAKRSLAENRPVRVEEIG